MMDSVYARTRSMREDLRWLVRGAALLFTARAWKPTLPRGEVRPACPQPSRVAGSKAEQGVGEPQEAELQTADS